MIRTAFLLIPLLCACKPQAQPSIAEVAYQNKTISSTKEDELSPTGVWEKLIEYPVLSGSNATMKKINADIYETATEYECDGDNGDKQFKAEVTLASNKIISMKFADTWYCLGMPHQEGRTGALTYELDTGRKVDFHNELKATTAESLLKKISSGLEQALIDKGINEECPSPTIGHFYLSDSGVVFVNKSEGETIQCEVEYRVDMNIIKTYLKAGSIFMQ